ncbi:unnamed protein product [Cochlearia groenlandica]
MANPQEILDTNIVFVETNLDTASDFKAQWPELTQIEQNYPETATSVTFSKKHHSCNLSYRPRKEPLALLRYSARFGLFSPWSRGLIKNDPQRKTINGQTLPPQRRTHPRFHRLRGEHDQHTAK